MNEVKKYIIIFVLSTIIVSGIWAIFYTKQSYESRGLCSQLREQLLDATDTNRRLGETVERCQGIAGELGDITQRNIGTAREAVELIEEIRTQVYNLEVLCGGFDWDAYYQRWDNEFFNDKTIQGVE